MEELRNSAFNEDCASITDGISGTALNHRWYIFFYNSQNGLFPLLAMVFFFSLLWFLYCAHGNCKHGYDFFKGPLKTFSFNDAHNLFLFSKSNTKMSFFSEIKAHLILIGLHLWFICFAYLYSMSFLFSWMSSTFPCYLLKYCISHEQSRLRHGSFCCCPLTGHRKLVDHNTCTPYRLYYLNSKPWPAANSSIAKLY